MTAKGHLILASVLAYKPVEYLLYEYIGIDNIYLPVVSYFSILFGALFPDIDEPKSYIGNKFTLIARFLKFIGLKHRTLTHWLIFPVLVIVSGYFISLEILSIMVMSFGIGILAHDIGDLLTKGGINGFLYPLLPNTKIALLPHFLRFKTFSIEEYIFILFLFLLNIYLYFNLAKNFLGVIV